MSFREDSNDIALAANSQTFLQEVSKIPGLNVEEALVRIGGLEDAYKEALTYFAKGLAESCEKMTGYLNDENMPSFAIEVHGAKGYLATIGKNDISELAARLETESKGGNLGYCKQHFMAFLSEYQSFGTELTEVLGIGKRNTQNMPAGDPAMLLNALAAAKEELSGFDSDAALELVMPTQDYTFGTEIDEELSAFCDYCSNMSFQKAIASAEKIEQLLMR